MPLNLENVHCPHLEHLHFCDDFTCPTMFKCSQSYCIPTYRLCDSIQDCPNSEDEVSCGSNYSCPGHLRCRTDGLCIHPENICDGVPHCVVDLDDELFCDLTWCPIFCQCHGSLLSCTSENPGYKILTLEVLAIVYSEMEFQLDYTLIKSKHLNYIYINGSRFYGNTILPILLHGLTYLKNLYLTFNSIMFITKHSFIDLINLHDLDLRGNLIHSLSESTFNDPLQLRRYDLSMTQVKRIVDNVFSGLHHLVVVNLSFNLISHIHQQTFNGIRNLQVLDLRYNSFQFIHTDAFVHLEVALDIRLNISQQHCYTSKQQQSTLSEHKECLNIFSSQHIYMRSVYLICGTCILVINNINVVCQWFTQRNYIQLLINLHIIFTNSIVISYIFILVIASFITHNDFLYMSDIWVNNWYCKLIGSTVTVGVVLTKYVMLVLRLNHLRVTKYALHYGPITRAQLSLILSFGWFILLSYHIVVASHIESASAVSCASFHLNLESAAASIATTSTSVIVSFITMISGVSVQVIIIKYVTESTTRVRKHHRSESRFNATRYITQAVLIEGSTMILFLFIVIYPIIFQRYGLLYQFIVLLCLSYISSIHSIVSLSTYMKTIKH